LEKEKIEAEVYKKIHDELRTHRATLVKKDLDSIDKFYTKAVEFLSKAGEEIKQKEKLREEAKAKTDEIQKECDELAHKIIEESDKKQSGVRREIEETRAGVSIIEGRIGMLKERIEESLRRKEQFNLEISRMGNEIKAREKELNNLDVSEDDLLKKLHEQQREIQKVMKGSGSIDKELEQSLKKVEDLNRQINERKEKIYKADSEFNSANERFNLKKSLADSKKRELEKLKSLINESEQKLKVFSAKKVKLEAQVSESTDQVAKYIAVERDDRERLEKIDSKLADARSEFSTVSSRIATIQKMTGINEATSAVLKEKSLKGMLGTVIDLCKYSPDSATAIETAAGPKLYYVVTETALHATEAVKFLKKNKIGKTTFVPIDKIKPVVISKQAEALAKKKGAVGFAINLIDFDSKLKPVMEFVFGDTLVVEDIDSAKEIGIGSIKMVTLDGDLIEYSGAVTGGFTKKGASKADQRLLEQAEQSVKQLEQDKAAVLGNLNNMKERITLGIDSRSKTELLMKEIEVQMKEQELRLKEYDEKRISSELLQIEKDLGAIDLEAKEKKTLKSGFEAELSTLIEQKTKLRIKFTDEGVAVSPQSEELENLQKLAQATKDEMNELKVKKSTIKLQIESVIIANQNKLKKEIKELDRLNAESEQKAGQLSGERNDLFNSLKLKEENARKLATSMGDMFRQKEELEKKRDSFAQKVGMCNAEIDKVRETSRESELDKAKYETQYVDLKRQWEKYKEVTLIEKISRKDLEDKIAQYEKQLENIGNVNLKAIDMFDEIAKEVAGMKGKKAKLEEEQTMIMNMMVEIEEKKITVFAETFGALNKYFDKYFRQFYPEEGAEASLSLENPEEPLEGGLLIQAKPAGKALKHMDSMSGGEKTLTALAFIFAVQAYRPSPFYVLDEVDAALDKENSERVAKMMKKFSKEIQLISVTHNAVVIRNADQVVGVHMDGTGSSVVQVDLKGLVEEKQAKLAQAESAIKQGEADRIEK
ncbi:MAG: chromosome segregation SMC family protein, partial [Candidatus Micrarchaeota archaeon]